jgi:hypothetical protein
VRAGRVWRSGGERAVEFGHDRSKDTEPIVDDGQEHVENVENKQKKDLCALPYSAGTPAVQHCHDNTGGRRDGHVSGPERVIRCAAYQRMANANDVFFLVESTNIRVCVSDVLLCFDFIFVAVDFFLVLRWRRWAGDLSENGGGGDRLHGKSPLNSTLPPGLLSGNDVRFPAVKALLFFGSIPTTPTYRLIKDVCQLKRSKPRLLAPGA